MNQYSHCILSFIYGIILDSRKLHIELPDGLTAVYRPTKKKIAKTYFR